MTTQQKSTLQGWIPSILAGVSLLMGIGYYQSSFDTMIKKIDKIEDKVDKIDVRTYNTEGNINILNLKFGTIEAKIK